MILDSGCSGNECTAFDTMVKCFCKTWPVKWEASQVFPLLPSSASAVLCAAEAQPYLLVRRRLDLTSHRVVLLLFTSSAGVSRRCR